MGPMSRPLLVCLAVLALCLAGAPAAPAFDTGPHTDITAEAMRAEGFGKPAADVGTIDNYFVDLYSNAEENPYSGDANWFVTLIGSGYGDREHWPAAVTSAAGLSHFDSQRLRNFVDTAAAEREWSRLRRAVFLELRAARAHRSALEVLTVIGSSLHPLQDFYAHTNWVEPCCANRSPGWEAKGQGATPTWFDVPKAVRDDPTVTIFPGSFPDDARTHGNWQADTNLSLTTAMAKDWPGRPLFDKAYMSSYFASRQWIAALRGWLGDDALWGRAQRYAERLGDLAFDLRGAYDVAAYSGHWSGEGGPCKYVVSCGGDDHGLGGSLLGLRQAVKGYFEDRPGGTIYRRTFQRLLPGMAVDEPLGVSDSQVEIGSSRALQAATRFVRLRVMSTDGIDLGDIGPDDAELYARATIAGQDFTSAMIQGRDRFAFPKPYAPYTFIQAVPRGGSGGTPISTLTVRIRTSGARYAGTDDDVYLRTGPGAGERFLLDKRVYDDFERGDDDLYSVPIDAIARRGFTLGDLRMVQIEKSRDGIAGGWKLGAVTVKANGQTVYAKTGIERWLEDDRRTWRAPDFGRHERLTDAVPVWLDLREDDIVYGGDDQGDINRFDARDAVVRAFRPGGPIVDELVTGGRVDGGRLTRGGDVARVRFVIDTLDTTVPAPAPPLGPVVDLPVAQPAPPAPPPTTTTPTTTTPTTTTPPPPPTHPDLVVTALTLSQVTVKNQGDGPAGASTVQVNDAGHRYAVGALAAGASATVAWTPGSCTGGNTATADVLDVVSESDETNNALFEPLIC
jgi:PLAT/LH2 domain/CARDB